MWHDLLWRMAVHLLCPRLTAHVGAAAVRQAVGLGWPALAGRSEGTDWRSLAGHRPAARARDTGVSAGPPPERVRVSRCFIPRDEESAALREAFAAACRGRSVTVWVGGCAGTGKTTLVRETFQPPGVARGYFVSGKFDQLRPDVPYAPLLRALGDLMRQFLTESPESLAQWEKRLRRALGWNIPVVTALIPEVGLIAPARVPAEDLPPKEAQNRFRLVFRNLVKALSARKHPLVLFLDDLQWADPDSCRLIGQLAEDPALGGLLLILAGRENEMPAGHPFRAALAEIERGGSPLRRITVKPFDRLQTGRFAAGSLQSPVAPPLAEALYRKTGGNPFFLDRLLCHLRDNGLLVREAGTGRWTCEPSDVDRVAVPEDVAAFMAARLQALPARSRDILKAAACMGNVFDLASLSLVCGTSTREAAAVLETPLAEGLILPVPPEHGSGALPGAAPAFEFLHDHVRQAAYSLVPEPEKQRLHLHLGRMILAAAGEEGPDEKICVATDHLNRGRDLIRDRAGRVEAARHNLSAGRVAAASGAFASARDYFRTGLELLPEDSWRDHRRLTYDLYRERCQGEYLCSDFAAAGEMFEVLLARCGSDRERADIYGMKAVLCTSLRDYPEAIRMALRALGCLGMTLPARPKTASLCKELLCLRRRLAGKTLGDLAGLPEVTDPGQKEILHLLAVLAVAAFPVHPPLYALVVLKGLNHLLRYGATDFLYPCFAAYCSLPGPLAASGGGGAASVLGEKCTSGRARGLGHYVTGSQISHWSEPAAVGLDYLRQAVAAAFASGDFVLAGYALIRIMELKCCMGASLEELGRECRENRDLGRRIQHETLVLYAAMFDRFVAALRDEDTGCSGPEDYGDYDEAVDGVSKVSMVVHGVLRAQLRYLSDDGPGALAAAERSRPSVAAVGGGIVLAEHCFYHSLAVTAVYAGLPADARRRCRKVLRQNQARMKKWSDRCEANYRHKYLLVEAETARLDGRDDRAMTLYDRSIRSAAEHGYVQNQALAAELAARFYLARGQERIARLYLVEACENYARWGAAARVRALRERHAGLLSAPEEEAAAEARPAGDASSVDGWRTVRRALEKLTRAGHPRGAMDGFLAMAMESAGADRGYLILEKEGDLLVEAFRDGTAHAPGGTLPLALEEGMALSLAVVRYVVRTLEPVVLTDEARPAIFARDPHAVGWRGGFIACLPLVFLGAPLGVLYLENTVPDGAFTPEHLELLQGFCVEMSFLRKLSSHLEDERHGPAGHGEVPAVDPLTARETEILGLVAAGLSNQGIADRLGIGVSTVKSHVLSIYGKLGVDRRVQAVNRARELGLLKGP